MPPSTLSCFIVVKYPPPRSHALLPVLTPDQAVLILNPVQEEEVDEKGSEAEEEEEEEEEDEEDEAGYESGSSGEGSAFAFGEDSGYAFIIEDEDEEEDEEEEARESQTKIHDIYRLQITPDMLNGFEEEARHALARGDTSYWRLLTSSASLKSSMLSCH